MIKRATAAAYIPEIIARAQAINNREYAWAITRIEVFGSYLTDKPVLGDLDLMVTLAPRYADQDRQAAIMETRQSHAPNAWRNRNPSWMVYFWPKEEVHRMLRDGKRHISIHEFDERAQLVTMGASFESIFGASL